MSFKILFEFIGLIVTTAVGDYCSKQYALYPGGLWLTAFVLAYNAGLVFWILLLRRLSLAQAGFVWGLVATAVLILISQVVFREPLTCRQWCGIVLGFVAMILLL